MVPVENQLEASSLRLLAVIHHLCVWQDAKYTQIFFPPTSLEAGILSIDRIYPALSNDKSVRLWGGHRQREITIFGVARCPTFTHRVTKRIVRLASTQKTSGSPESIAKTFKIQLTQ
uniref:Uncharacterized protein n=1 Tax=Candidozyma auris TaxID=498019 RepID=A0A0L0NPB8_CANAR